MKLSFPTSRRAAAFTMVEIAISLAVIAFALVAIIGVLPSGMTVQRENREETIINQEATVFINAVRNGARGSDDLTNYVYDIKVYYTQWTLEKTGTEFLTNSQRSGVDSYTWDDSDVQSAPGPKVLLRSGYRIIGLLSRPKYELFPVGSPEPTTLRSNHIVALVRAMSGVAAEKPPQANLDVRADAFSYRLIIENQRVQAYDTTSKYAEKFINNLREVRLTFRWPLTATGAAGNGRQVFRFETGGELDTEFEAALPQPFFFFKPAFYQ